MRLFLDECVDWRFGRLIPMHDVRTARQMGWTAIKNGQLLALASAQFEAFVTVDQNLRFQQNLSRFRISICILRAKTNRLVDLEPLVHELLITLETAAPGTIHFVPG